MVRRLAGYTQNTENVASMERLHALLPEILVEVPVVFVFRVDGAVTARLRCR